MGIHFQSKHHRKIIMNCFKVLALFIGVCSAASTGKERQCINNEGGTGVKECITDGQSYGQETLQCQPLIPVSQYQSDPRQFQSPYTYIEPGKMYQLQSPNYPGLYPNSQECAFQFVSNGQVDYDASFWCDDFDVKASQDCYKDYVEFWVDPVGGPSTGVKQCINNEDGLTGVKECIDGPTHTRLCNSNYDGSFINIPNRRHLGIEFRTNRKGATRGFSCWVTFWYSGAVDGSTGEGEGPTPNDPRSLA